MAGPDGRPHGGGSSAVGGPAAGGSEGGGSGGTKGPRDDYRVPLLPGGYPPLGYSPTGAPRFTPADLGTGIPGSASGPTASGLMTPGSIGPGSPAASATGSPTTLSGPAPGSPGGPAGPPGGDGPTPPPRRLFGIEPGVGTTVGVFVVVGALVVGLLLVAVNSLRDRPEEITLPPATITDEYTLPTLTPNRTPTPSRPRTTRPTVPGGGVGPVGESVTYTVTIEGSGTILYVDDTGVHTEFSPPPTWTLTFTADTNPLRLVVVVGQGSSAQCSINVGQEQVVTDTVAADSTRRTASCIA
ncbi:hypothetical protein [Gordonia sp. NB41Y]|uniref:hypothetical protein n=1 Tax=Gordonia sp. NB41Y TaxID=875808 RepID=UPI00128E97CC|nr:hypothetical protein [Gordonia sp. NB41Y]WLP92686.1 hypothetical protein Q9K23_10905 [Gordonia sp. NB41Y]